LSAVPRISQPCWRGARAVLAQAISRNIIVIAAGFLPLLLAPLIPYKTVGMLLATILFVAGLSTLLILPAAIRLLEPKLFIVKKAVGPGCNCGLCLLSAAAVVAIVTLVIQPYVPMDWTTLRWIAAAILPLTALICGLSSRRQKCKMLEEQEHREEAP